MLGAALRDRGRVLPRTQDATVRVEGTILTTTGPPGPEFRCLYDPGNESETRDNARVRRVRPASLLTGTRATDGSVLDIKAHDRVEIVTREGALRFEVMGTPTPIKKRRTILGWTCRLQEVKA